MKAIGLDIGTTTVCAIVADGETGFILETVTEQNQSFIKTENPWERTQDPSIILQQVETIITTLVKKHTPVVSIGLTGQMHGIVYVDEAGNAVSPLYTWQDGRGDLEYAEGMSYAAYMTSKTGCKLATGFGAVTHYYNSILGLVPKTAKYFCTIHDYAAMRLSNNTAVRMHPSNAASMGLYDFEKNCFDREVICLLGMDEGFFSEIAEGAAVVGKTSSQIPVAVAIGDNQASFLGAVRDTEECLSVNIGTSSQISIYTAKYRENSPVEIRPFAESGYLMVGCPLCGGRSYALLEGFFNAVVQMATGQETPHLYDVMEQTAFEYMDRTDKLNVCTKFSGTREKPLERASVQNLGTGNFTPGHLIVGILEGIARELYDLYTAVLPYISSKPKQMVCSGNGVRMNRSLQKILSNMFGMPLSIPLYREEAAYGAALFSLVAAGFFASTAETQRLIQYE